PEPARARARAKKLFKTLRVSNSNSNYYDNTDERYTTSNDLTPYVRIGCTRVTDRWRTGA
ncbi:MAG: hypothetical protein QOJ63_3772, partial [Solirubrobacteraceae bacterium]|nr:hypothetical protein [Solirubrobacteraceae bacterium]